MVEIVGHSQTKGRDNREPKLRPKPARQSSTLLMSGDGKRGDGQRPQATAPILDSTTTDLETGNCRRRAASLVSCKPSQCSQPDCLGKLTNGQPIHHARPMHVDRACASELGQLFGVGAIGDHKALGLSFPLARTSISRLIEIEQRGQRYF